VVHGQLAYEVEVPGGDPGDALHLRFEWRDDGILLVSRDFYGGDGAFDVETRHELERVDVAGWPAIDGTEELVRHENLEGEPQRILSARGEGQSFDPCPTSGWVVTCFRAGNEDVTRSWVVLYGGDGSARVAYAARQR
jgi:hypothetical protein